MITTSKKSIYKALERKKAVTLLKKTSFFNGAEPGGIMGGKPRRFALNDWTQNFWAKLKDKPINYFKKNGIDWNVYAQQGHLLSSQVCCVNHLFPIRHDKENVLRLAKAVCPGAVDVLPIGTDKYLPKYIQFEAISDTDHLNEGPLARGKNCTSVDALIHAVHKNGKKYLIPIEWKYTESYDDTDLSIEDKKGDPKGSARKGKERLARYSKLIDDSAALKSLPSYRSSIYFFEPFYQLMRLTLWAEQMVLHKQDEKTQADDYIHVHIVPSENAALLDKIYKVSQKPLKETWLDHLNDKRKYVLMSPMDFMKHIDNKKYSELLNYVQERYWKKAAVDSRT